MVSLENLAAGFGVDRADTESLRNEDANLTLALMGLGEALDLLRNTADNQVSQATGDSILIRCKINSGVRRHGDQLAETLGLLGLEGRAVDGDNKYTQAHDTLAAAPPVLREIETANGKGSAAMQVVEARLAAFVGHLGDAARSLQEMQTAFGVVDAHDTAALEGLTQVTGIVGSAAKTLRG